MMTDLFDVDGANLDRGFENLKAAELPIEQQLHAMLQEMWGRYEPYADPDFRQGFLTQSEQPMVSIGASSGCAKNARRLRLARSLAFVALFDRGDFASNATSCILSVSNPVGLLPC